jgi:hypothetical protein
LFFSKYSFCSPLLVLHVPVQCMSFYCTLWFTECMVNPTPFSFPFFSVCICFVLCHNSTFEVLSGYMTFIYVIGISPLTLRVFSYFPCSTPVQYDELNIYIKQLKFSF